MRVQYNYFFSNHKSGRNTVFYSAAAFLFPLPPGRDLKAGNRTRSYPTGTESTGGDFRSRRERVPQMIIPSFANGAFGTAGIHFANIACLTNAQCAYTGKNTLRLGSKRSVFYPKTQCVLTQNTLRFTPKRSAFYNRHAVSKLIYKYIFYLFNLLK